MRNNRQPLISSARSVLVRTEEALLPPPGVMAARRELGWDESEVTVVRHDPTDPRVPIVATSTAGNGLPQWTVAFRGTTTAHGEDRLRETDARRNPGSGSRNNTTGRSVVHDVLGEPWEILSDDNETNSGRQAVPPPVTVTSAPETPGPCPGTPGIDRRRRLAPPTPAPNKRLKGSLNAALQFTQSAELREKAQAEYMDSVYAQQTVSSKTALRQTWSKISQSLGYEPVPLTAPQIHEVAAALRAAGYRSATAYICEASQGHRRKGFPITDVLHMAIRDAKRAVTRALGPPRRAPEVPLRWLAALCEKGPRDESCGSWPNDRYEVWVFATRFILREQELACVFIHEIEMNHRLQQVTLNLPVTKCDAMGRGARRTLGCICTKCPDEKTTCPYCITNYLLQRQERRLGIRANDAEAFEAPLVGRQEDPRVVVEKTAMIEAFKYDMGILSDTFPEAQGLLASEVTGHTFRRSGVKELARKNTPLPLIQFFARHSSAAALGYVEEAYEESPDGNLQVLNHLEMRDQIAALSSKTNDMTKAYDQLKAEYEELAAKCNLPLDRSAVLKMFNQWSHPEVVINLMTGKTHSTAGNAFRNHPNEWVTACGWPWIAAGRIAKAALEPSDMHSQDRCTPCERCRDKLPEWARPEAIP